MKNLREKKLKHGLFLFALFATVATFFFKAPQFLEDAPSGIYSVKGKPCIYYNRIPDTLDPDFPANSCLYESQETGFELSPQVDALISRLIERDFPDHTRSKVMDLNEAGYLDDYAVPMQWSPLIKAVWPCAFPEIQPLTTTTSALALCEVTPSISGKGYDSSVNIYELHHKKHGIVPTLLYHESSTAKELGATSVLMGAGFSVFGGRLIAIVEKHRLQDRKRIQTQSRILVPRDGMYQSIFEFDSFFYSSRPRECESEDPQECQITKILFDTDGSPPSTGGSVIFEEYWGRDTAFVKAAKKIPFIFDSTNWTMKRKFQRKSDDDF